MAGNFYLRFPAAPNLPLAPGEWDARFQEQLTNVFRLYFNQLSNSLQQLGGNRGGAGLNFPYGSFHQDGTTTLSSGITNVSTTPISVASTANFPSSGWILIDSEIIQYTAKTATTFAGTITRNVFGTSSAAHSAGAVAVEVQGVPSATTAGTALLNFTDLSNGVYVSTVDNSRIYFAVAGIYNIQFSAQLLNYTTTDDNVTLWLTQNGVAVPSSAGEEQVNAKHGSAPGARIAAWNYVIEVGVNDYVSLKWASATGNTVIATVPAGTAPVTPSSPALIFTASFVSSLPSLAA